MTIVAQVSTAPSTVSDPKPLVGEPVAEARLTEAVLRHAHSLIAPGPGRRLLALSEVELGLGRPDIVLLSASPNGLDARARRGLRLANLTEAQILASLHGNGCSQHSDSHVRAVSRRLVQGGWIDRRGAVRPVRSLIDRSLLIEAKIKDWRNGVGQLTRTRWVAERSALLVPSNRSHLVPRTMLRHNRVGLVIERPDGTLRWEVRPRPRRLSFLADVWLTELAIRHLEQAVD